MIEDLINSKKNIIILSCPKDSEAYVRALGKKLKDEYKLNKDTGVIIIPSRYIKAFNRETEYEEFIEEILKHRKEIQIISKEDVGKVSEIL